MRFEISGKRLKTAVSTAAASLEKHGVVRCDVGHGVVSFRAVSREAAITIGVNARVTETGSVGLDDATVASLLRPLRAKGGAKAFWTISTAPAADESGEQYLDVRRTGAPSGWAIKCDAAPTYAGFPFPAGDVGAVRIGLGRFDAAWRAVRPAASRDRERPHLAGVGIDLGEKRLVATDGHRMHVGPTDCTTVDDEERVPVAVVPAMALPAIDRLAHGWCEAELSIVVDDGSIDVAELRLDAAPFHARVEWKQSVRFPPWRVVTPSATAPDRSAVTVARDALDTALDDMRRGGADTVRMSVLDGRLHLVGVRCVEGTGPAVKKLVLYEDVPGLTRDVEIAGAWPDDLVIDVNVGYVRDGLYAVADTSVELHAAGPHDVIEVRGPRGRDDGFAVIMPVRL